MKEKRIKEIIDDFCKHADEPWIGDRFDGGFYETIYGCEDTWGDTPSTRLMLIENYLLWYGYDNVENYIEEGETYKSVGQMLNEYDQRTKWNIR